MATITNRSILWYIIRPYVVGTAIVLALIACVCSLNEFVIRGTAYECRYTARNANVETKFVRNNLISSDCYVRIGDGWIPIDRWRGVQE
jgi:hypothetical protein